MCRMLKRSWKFSGRAIDLRGPGCLLTRAHTAGILSLISAVPQGQSFYGANLWTTIEFQHLPYAVRGKRQLDRPDFTSCKIIIITQAAYQKQTIRATSLCLKLLLVNIEQLQVLQHESMCTYYDV